MQNAAAPQNNVELKIYVSSIAELLIYFISFAKEY